MGKQIIRLGLLGASRNSHLASFGSDCVLLRQTIQIHPQHTASMPPVVLSRFPWRTSISLEIISKVIFRGALLCVSLGFAQTSLTLSDCLAAARTHSPQVKQASQGVTAAQAKKDQARTHWFPSVSAQVTAFKTADYLMNVETEGGNLPVYDGNPANLMTATQFAYMPPSSMGFLDQMGIAMISAVQPLYMGGRIQTGNQLANLGVEVARIQVSQAEKDVVFATIERYQGLVALHAMHKTLEAQIQLMDTLAREVRLAFQGGLATSRDTLELALRQSEVRNNLYALNDGIPLAERDLCRSLDDFCTGPLTLLDTLGPIDPPEVVRTDHDAALGKREESRLLDKSVEAEGLQGTLAQGELRPQVLVGAAVMGMTEFRDTPTGNALIFANVSVPLTGIWEGAHRSQESKIKKEKASVNAKEMKSLLRLEMDKSWNDLQVAWRALELAQSRLVSEHLAMSDSRQKFAQGVEKASDLVTAQLKLQAAESGEIGARRDYLRSRAYYLKATGRDPGL